MTRRSPIGWYLGLVALVVIPSVLATALVWIASGQTIRVNEFYTSQGNVVTSEEEYRYWDAISRSAYQQVTIVAPTLFTGALVATFVLLAVLAFRWERRPKRTQAGATAAS